jgi:hypothetical protein
MRLRNAITICAAGLSLAATPVLAQTTPTRASAQLAQPSFQEDESEASDGFNVRALIFIAVVVVVVVIALTVDDDGSSTSP